MTEKILVVVLFTLFIFNKSRLTKGIHRLDKIPGTVYHRWNTKLIYALYFIPFFLSPAEYIAMGRSINYPLSFTFLAVYAAGLELSRRARKTLDRYWTVNIEIRENHPLIKDGPYRYMRHPHYLYTYIELFSLPLIAGAYYTFILTALVFIPLLTLRIIYEEKEMVRKLGEGYLEYKRQVWGVFPFPLFKKGLSGE